MPIVGERVRALLEQSPEWSAKTLADELQQQGIPGASRQTIGYICSGRNKTCRAPVRGALAALFGIPEEWFGDADSNLVAPASDYFLHVDDDRSREHQMIPPRSELAIYITGRKVAAAWHRDLAGGVADLPTWVSEEFRQWVEEDRDKALTKFITRALFAFFSLWRWRSILLLDASAKVSLVEADRFTPAFTEAVEALLGPWMDGKQKLNYDAFYATIRLVMGIREPGMAPILIPVPPDQ